VPDRTRSQRGDEGLARAPPRRDRCAADASNPTRRTSHTSGRRQLASQLRRPRDPAHSKWHRHGAGADFSSTRFAPNERAAAPAHGIRIAAVVSPRKYSSLPEKLKPPKPRDKGAPPCGHVPKPAPRDSQSPDRMLRHESLRHAADPCVAGLTSFEERNHVCWRTCSAVGGSCARPLARRAGLQPIALASPRA